MKILNNPINRGLFIITIIIWLYFVYGYARLTVWSDSRHSSFGAILGGNSSTFPDYETIPVIYLKWCTVLERTGLSVVEQVCCNSGYGYYCTCWQDTPTIQGFLLYTFIPAAITPSIAIIHNWIKDEKILQRK